MATILGYMQDIWTLPIVWHSIGDMGMVIDVQQDVAVSEFTCFFSPPPLD